MIVDTDNVSASKGLKYDMARTTKDDDDNDKYDITSTAKGGQRL